MKPLIAEYIDVITSKGNITQIDLFNLGLTNEELSPLIEALKENPDVAERITVLLLGNNLLKTTPDLTMFTGLETLNLSNNSISEPPDLTNLIKIKNLHISLNLLKKAPVLTMLKKLENISIDNNELTESPDFTGLIYLESIELSDNYLNTPPNLTGLVSLKTLGLRNNKLYLAPVLTELTALKKINLYGNQLTVASEIILGAECEMRGQDFTLYLIEQSEIQNINQLNTDILNKHFQKILDNTDDAIAYMRSIGALGLHNKLQSELVTGPLLDMLAPPALALAWSSMNYFKNVAAESNNVPMMELLNKYAEINFEDYIGKVRKHYSAVYKHMSGIINSRNKEPKTPYNNHMLYLYTNTALEQRPLKDMTRVDTTRNPYALVKRG